MLSERNNNSLKHTINMKKITLLVLFLGLVGFTANSNAQNMQGDFAVGLGAAYGFDVEELGINANVNYSFTDEIRAAVDFTYYLADSDFTIWEFNANAHYLFMNEMDLRIYALAGLQYYNFEFEFDLGGFGTLAAEDDGIGFNVGAGIEYDLGGIMLFAEPKFTISGLEQLNVTAGVRFAF